jgi:hypothetical protein
MPAAMVVAACPWRPEANDSVKNVQSMRPPRREHARRAELIALKQSARPSRRDAKARWWDCIFTSACTHAHTCAGGAIDDRLILGGATLPLLCCFGTVAGAALVAVGFVGLFAALVPKLSSS